MKIIDQTPFYNQQTGKISLVDRGRAVMAYGAEWLKEVEAQQQVISLLATLLDKKFTLLHNLTPPGMDAIFPLILVGPPGVYVFYVTGNTGTMSARGDQWGRISSGAFKDEKPNLLIRTERMGTAIRIFLRRYGFSEQVAIDTAILCSDPGFNVECSRPIVRVVMRDALEHYAASLSQARTSLSPETVHAIVEAFTQETRDASDSPNLAPPSVRTDAGDNLEFSTHSPQDSAVSTDKAVESADIDLPSVGTPGEQHPLPGWEVLPPESLPAESAIKTTKKASRQRMKPRQRFLLLAVFVIWCLLVGVFIYLVLRDQGLSLLSLLP